MRPPFLTIILLCITAKLFSQPSSIDTSFIDKAKHNAITFYESSMENQKLYFNGGAYSEPRQTLDDQFPFYIYDDWVTGTIDFDGNHFEDVPLMYDISRDLVLTENKSATPLVLVREKLKAFLLDDKQFVHINNTEVNNSLPRSGFYHVLYPGKTRVIGLHEKHPQEKIQSNMIDVYYDARNRYFIWHGNNFYQVSSKGSVLKLLHDQKHSLKIFIRQNKISFKAGREQALIAIAQHYDTLISNQ